MTGNCGVCIPMECSFQGEVPGCSGPEKGINPGWSRVGHLIFPNIYFRSGLLEDVSIGGKHVLRVFSKCKE